MVHDICASIRAWSKESGLRGHTRQDRTQGAHSSEGRQLVTVGFARSAFGLISAFKNKSSALLSSRIISLSTAPQEK